jgi:hypothetical protein
MAIEIPILKVDAAPICQQIAVRVRHLQELGMNRAEIAWHVRCDWKTVATALAWQEDVKGLRPQHGLSAMNREVEIRDSRR